MVMLVVMFNITAGCVVVFNAEREATEWKEVVGVSLTPI
jgi:hypothetical protein